MDLRQAIRSSTWTAPRPKLAALVALLLGVGLLVGPAGGQQADPGQQQDRPTNQADQPDPDKPNVDLSGSPVPAKQSRPPTLPMRSSKTQIPTETPKGNVTGAPAIRVDQPVHDFGDQWQDGTLKHGFVVRNGGDQELEIQSVKASCGCTVVKGYDHSIPPGGTGTIPLELSAKKVRSKFTKFVTITSNDPVTPAVRLAITGKVKPYVAVEPSRLNMGHIAEDAVVSKSVALVNNTEESVLIILEYDKNGPFTAELVQKTPGKEYELLVTANPPYTPKLNSGNFVLDTTLPKQAKIEVPVTVYVPPRLELRPEYVELRSSRPTQQQLRISFTNSGEKPVRVLSATVDDEDLQLEVVEQEAGKLYDIMVTIPPGYEPPIRPRTITLATDDPQKPELTVPFKGKPKPKPRPAKKLVGQTAPRAEFTTISGQTIKTGEPTGKVTVLDFFTSSSGNSKRQLATLASVLQMKFADNPEVLFVGICQDDLKQGRGTRPPPTPEQIDSMWARTGATFEYALDPQGLGRSKFLVSTYPTLMILGRDGKVEAVHFGARLDLDAVVEKQVNDLLTGKSLTVPESDLKVDTGHQARTTEVMPADERRLGVDSGTRRRARQAGQPAPREPAPPSPEPAGRTDQAAQDTPEDQDAGTADEDRTDPAKDTTGGRT